MQEVFKGFLRLRLLGLLALVIVVSVVLGISSLSRGSTLVGVAILGGVVVVSAAIGLLAERRETERRR